MWGMLRFVAVDRMVVMMLFGLVFVAIFRIISGLLLGTGTSSATSKVDSWWIRR